MLRIAESQSIIHDLFHSFQVIERLDALPEAYRKEISTNIADKLCRLILLDIKQVKGIFGVSEQIARRLPLPGIRVGCRLKYSLTDLVDYVEKNKELNNKLDKASTKKMIERRRDELIEKFKKGGKKCHSGSICAKEVAFSKGKLIFMEKSTDSQQKQLTEKKLS